MVTVNSIILGVPVSLRNLVYLILLVGICLSGWGCGSNGHSTALQPIPNFENVGTVRLSVAFPQVQPQQTQAQPRRLRVTVSIGGAVLQQSENELPPGSFPGPVQIEVPGVPLDVPVLVTVVALDDGGAELLDFEQAATFSAPNALDLTAFATPVSETLSGVAFLQPLLVLDPDSLASLKSSILPQLEADGFRLTEDGNLLYPPFPAANWTVRLGDGEALTEADGSFRILRSKTTTTVTLSHPTHEGYGVTFDSSTLSPGQRAEHGIAVIQAFRGGCGMSTEGSNDFCGGATPRLAQEVVRAQREPGIIGNRCGFAVPRPTEVQLLDRGEYARPLEETQDVDIECHDRCERDNGAIRNAGKLTYLGSTCFQFVRAGACPNENAIADTEFLLPVVVDSIAYVFGARKPPNSIDSIAPPVVPGRDRACMDNHKGRLCQQVSIGDVSLDLSNSDDGGILFPQTKTRVIRVRRGDRLDFVLHNNGVYGVTELRAIVRGIGGTLHRTYREVPFQRVVPFRESSSDPLLAMAPLFGFFSNAQRPAEIEVTPVKSTTFGFETKQVEHFLATGVLLSDEICFQYRYFSDVALQYRVPTNAPIGLRDRYRFSTDICSVDVIFELVEDAPVTPTPTGTPSASPTPSPSPTETPLINVGVSSVSRTHVVTVTPCPQELAEIPIGNASGETVNVSISASPPLFVDSPNFQLTPGGLATPSVFFDCSTTTSFASTLTITATSPSRTVMQTIPVNLNISFP